MGTLGWVAVVAGAGIAGFVLGRHFARKAMGRTVAGATSGAIGAAPVINPKVAASALVMSEGARKLTQKV